MNEDKEIPLITFNSFYNLLRDEKKNKSLNSIPEGFYESVKQFLENKKEEINKVENIEKKKKEIHIYTKSKEMFIELINLRTRKIANIAIKNSLFGDDTMETKNIIDKENKIYKEIYKIIKEFKEIEKDIE